MTNPLITLYTLIKDKALNEQNLSELLERGVNLNFAPITYEQAKLSLYTHMTPLSFACKMDSPIETIRLLLDHGADPTIRDNLDRRTPLLWACEYVTDIKVLELLLERGADANESYAPTHRDSHTALVILSVNDRPSEYTELLLTNGADPNRESPFAYCFGFADYSMDYNKKTTFKNSVAIGELLIMAGATSESLTLEIPLKAHAPDEAFTFLLRECDLQATPEDFYSFCAYAIPSIELIDLFMAKGAALTDLRRVVGLLIYQDHSYNAIKHIIEFVHNANYWSSIFAVDPNYGYEGTILHYACHNKRQDLVNLFLSAGINAEIKDNGCHIIYIVDQPVPSPLSYAYSLIEAGKLIVIYRDPSSKFEQYMIMARDKHGNIITKLWNFTPPEKYYYKETMSLGKDFIGKLKEVEFAGPAVASYAQEECS